jgi:hypothetical protein
MIGQYDFNFGEVNSIWEDFRLPEQSVLDSGQANIGSPETDFTHTLLFGTKTDAFGRLAGSCTTTPLTCPSPPPRARPVLVTCCWSGCTTSGPVVGLTRPPHRPSPTVVDPDYTEAFPSAVGGGGPLVGSNKRGEVPTVKWVQERREENSVTATATNGNHKLVCIWRPLNEGLGDLRAHPG